MRKPEQNLWDAFRRNKPRGVWAVRVENLIDDGMPDVWIAPGLWVELKVPTTKSKAIDSGALRPSQHNWLAAAALAGVPAFVLARSAGAGIVLVPAEEVPAYQQASAKDARLLWGYPSMRAVWDELTKYRTISRIQ